MIKIWNRLHTFPYKFQIRTPWHYMMRQSTVYHFVYPCVFLIFLYYSPASFPKQRILNFAPGAWQITSCFSFQYNRFVRWTVRDRHLAAGENLFTKFFQTSRIFWAHGPCSDFNTNGYSFHPTGISICQNSIVSCLAGILTIRNSCFRQLSDQSTLIC